MVSPRRRWTARRGGGPGHRCSSAPPVRTCDRLGDFALFPLHASVTRQRTALRRPALNSTRVAVRRQAKEARATCGRIRRPRGELEGTRTAASRDTRRELRPPASLVDGARRRATTTRDDRLPCRRRRAGDHWTATSWERGTARPDCRPAGRQTPATRMPNSTVHERRAAPADRPAPRTPPCVTPKEPSMRTAPCPASSSSRRDIPPQDPQIR